MFRLDLPIYNFIHSELLAYAFSKHSIDAKYAGMLSKTFNPEIFLLPSLRIPGIISHRGLAVGYRTPFTMAKAQLRKTGPL